MPDRTIPPEEDIKPCDHVVKPKGECDHGCEPPYTSICSECGPDYGCIHAGIRNDEAR